MNTKDHKLIYEFSGSRNLNTFPLDVTGLDGDTWDYMVEIKGKATNPLMGETRIRFNNDTTSNYRRYNLNGFASSASADVNDSYDGIGMSDFFSSLQEGVARVLVSGESGSERYTDLLFSSERTSGTRINKTSGYWKNTADNLTSMQLYTAISATTTFTLRIYQVPNQANLANYDLMEVVDFSGRDLNANPIVFSGLDGDSDGEYLVKCSTDIVSGSSSLKLGVNGDIGANYTMQDLKNIGGTISSANYTNQGQCLSDYNASANPQKADFILDATSGRKRLVNCTASRQGGIGQQIESAHWYNNTVDNVFSLHLADLLSVNSTGSVKLYRRKSNRTIDPVPMMTSKVINVAGNFSTGQTISNIQGNRIKGAIKLEYTGIGNADIEVQFNTITANSNQQLKASTSTVSAASSAPTKIKLCGGSLDTTIANKGVTWIYPNSGQNRPCLNEQSYNSNALERNASWVNDDVNEITSITFTASNTNTMDGEIVCSIPMNTKQSSPSWN